MPYEQAGGPDGPAAEVAWSRLDSLPKAELHVHIEGTLEPELIFLLAERNGLALAFPDVATLARRYDFRCLQDFLDLYYANMAVLRTAADFDELARAYLARAARDGVRHAEIFFDPQAHTTRGVELEEVLEGLGNALAAAERDFGMTTGLIATFLRDRPAEEASELLEKILHLGTEVIGVGLDSAELGNPPSKFRSVFAAARAAGLRCVAHAGEEGPPQYVWEALEELQVARIDHGVRCMEDEALVARLAAERVPLTVCPISNVKLGVVRSLFEHPIAEMAKRGLAVTVNSDDPAYFGGYIAENYRQLAATFGFGATALADLARNSVEAAFLEPGRRRQLVREVARWEAQVVGQAGVHSAPAPDSRPAGERPVSPSNRSSREA